MYRTWRMTISMPNLYTSRWATGERATDLENLRECLDDTRVFVAIHLYSIDEGHLGLGPVAERLQNIGEVL